MQTLTIMIKRLVSTMLALVFIVANVFAIETEAKKFRSVKDVYVDLSLENASLLETFSKVESQTDFTFHYSQSDLKKSVKMNGKYQKVSVADILVDISKEAQLKFKQVNNNISVNRVKKSNQKTAVQVVEVILADITVSGSVTDETGEGLPGVNIKVKGTSTGTVTNALGSYTLTAPDDGTLVFSYIGYTTLEVPVGGRSKIDISLEPDTETLANVVVIGSRNPNRSAFDTAVPVDVIDISDLAATGAQVSITQILNYVAPSFTSQAQTVSDGTDHIDPAALRGLGPDQVLVLINGKRRHNTSLLNVNGTVGAGSVGTDLNAIPAASIKRIEVLRDGAAAQYGSDAIAGVINIVLKDETNKLDLAVTFGGNMSSKANHQEGGLDGEQIQIDANYGLKLGDKGGFVNFTGSIATREQSLRNATNLEQIYDIANAVENAFTSANGTPISDMSAANYQAGAALLGGNYISAADQASIAALDLSVDMNGNLNTPGDLALLSGFLPDGGTGEYGTYQELDNAQFAARGLERNDFRFRVGTSQLREGKFFANLSLPLSNNTELYAFGGTSYRQGLGYGFLREPWRPKSNVASNPNGFLPGIRSDINDQSLALGIKGESENGWKIDFSNTYGSNAFAFTVINSANASLKGSSPSTFDAGSFKFTQNTTNLDFSKFHQNVFSGMNVAFGAEYRVDHFEIFAGKENSYTTYDNNGIPTVGGVGGATNALGESLDGTSQVFGGFTPQNSTNKYRNNIGVYFDIEADITQDFLISLATRFESYSDFGETFNYKLASRYKLSDNFSIRGAFNTGFRAPSLQQQFFSRSSTVFNAAGIAEEVGLFTNDSQAAKLIGIGTLKQETSQNISLGVTGKIGDLSFTVDAYQITIEDRIVLSGKFDDGGDPVLESIFRAAGAGKAQFLANAIDTKNQGIDVVMSYNINVGSDMAFNNSLAATFSKTEVTNINVPTTIENAGLSGDFFDGQEEAFLTIAQPRTKLNLTHSLSNDNWTFVLRNVYFGEVTDPDEFAGQSRVEGAIVDPLAVYGGKIVTDITISRNLSESATMTIGANNILDVYPDENRPGSQSNASFPYSRRTSQFGFMGRYVFARFSFRL